MKKFTVFTIILTVIVVLVFGEMFVKEYFPALAGEDGENAELTLPEGLTTNVLGSDLGEQIKVEDPANADKTENDKLPDSELLEIDSTDNDVLDSIDIYDLTDEEDLEEAEENEPEMKTDNSNDDPKDFEDEDFVSVTNNVYLRDEQIKSAGFASAYLEDEAFDGKLYKTISVDDLADVEITKTVIRNKDALLAKVYIFKAGVDSNINEVYQLIKLRAGQGLGTTINETNDFGLASFYLNDPNRSQTAFLTVRIAGLIYAFSYPKEYHAQVKNLIMLIEWELG